MRAASEFHKTRHPRPGSIRRSVFATLKAWFGYLAKPSVLAWLVRGERLRHHAGAITAASVDFGVMIALVEAAGTSPVAATAAGALCGALTNFVLGRNWVFQRADAKATGQALRYALVAGASLGLNTLGEHLALRTGLGYLRARVLVAVLVSVLWNYPMHKFFVFGTRSQAPAER